MKKYVYTLLFAFSSLFMAEAQQLFDLKRCIETGLEQNYSIRIIRNEQQISDNNATPGNAGYLPTVDMRRIDREGEWYKQRDGQRRTKR